MSKNKSEKQAQRASYMMIDSSVFDIKDGKLIKKEDANTKKTKR
jgi:hypothetical protein